MELQDLINRNKNYIDELVSFFASNPAVRKAYFGLLYNAQDSAPDLFLAVEHEGDLDAIEEGAERIKKKFMPNRSLYFTSTEFQPELLGYIEQANFPFYVQYVPRTLNVAIMKQWFEPEKYRNELLKQVKTCILSSLFKDFDATGKTVNFQTFVRNEREFIPIFSDKDLIYKSGMTEIPPDLTVVEFIWEMIDKAFDGKLNKSYYVLNPGTSFEVEFDGL